MEIQHPVEHYWNFDFETAKKTTARDDDTSTTTSIELLEDAVPELPLHEVPFLPLHHRRKHWDDVRIGLEEEDAWWEHNVVSSMDGDRSSVYLVLLIGFYFLVHVLFLA